MFNKKFIFLILIIVSVVASFWIYSLIKRNGKTEPILPVSSKFEVTRTTPVSGQDIKIIPTTAIQFDFSKPINPLATIVATEPESNMSFEIADNRRSLFVRVLPQWELNKQYIIKISVESEEGERISELKYPLRILKIIESDFNETF